MSNASIGQQPPTPAAPTPLVEHEIEVRVRYCETDPMGLLHHARFFVFFEMGRTELLRAAGGNYREMEASGLLIVVVRADCRYLRPARYDDVLRIRTTVTRVTMAKIEHEYHVFRGSELLAIGHTLLAVVDRNGKIQPVPEWMQGEGGK
jgi:acyl-CoA thioester hydrolase